MSYGISDEVAEDFKLALEDLTMNSRYEISNLTVIAKENTEHALAISEALKDHIKRTAPAKKLPALYLLDSIVKNVGTPYTLFFGRQLYSTFMEAYALVDNNVRRKMEEMLKTWKEPVPGSIDTRPVFLPEVTRPIENALIKARTSAIQAHQEYARTQQQPPNRARVGPSSVPYRNTPTPPNVQRPSQYPAQTYGQPPNPTAHMYTGSSHPQQPYGAQQPLPTSQYQSSPAAPPSWQQQLPQSQGYRVPDDSIDTLNSDISRLIDAAKNEFAQNPHDLSILARLKALLDLQTILKRETLPPNQIALIKDQVKALSAASKQPAQPATPPVQTPVAVSQPSQHQSLASILGDPNALATLLARAAATQNATAPPPTNVQSVRSQPQYAPPTYPPPSGPAAKTPAVMPSPVSLLDQLRAAGMLPAGSVATDTPPIRQMPKIPLPGSFSGGFPPVPPSQSGRQTINWTGLANIPNDVQLQPASLKIPRPHLISTLYERLGVPCTQCGRRFQSDEEGKKKKAAHMDWHFRVHQRMVEAEKRGQHRSWFVDELDWIKSRETDEEHLASSTNVMAAMADKDAAPSSKGPKLQYLVVPDDPALKKSLCPICQEKFEMKWLDDIQEFVWMDAIKLGNRIYHASCHAEARKDGGNTPTYQRSTPDPVLGKRKNEDELMSLRTKIKTEP